MIRCKNCKRFVRTSDVCGFCEKLSYPGLIIHVLQNQTCENPEEGKPNTELKDFLKSFSIKEIEKDIVLEFARTTSLLLKGGEDK